MNIDIKVMKEDKYYFGDITWKGNAKYSDSILNVILGINKGDIYNLEILNKRLGKEISPGRRRYQRPVQDDGYLFFRVNRWKQLYIMIRLIMK